jgi:dienelactone hydrolase
VQSTKAELSIKTYAGAAHSFDLDIIPQRYLGKMLGHNKVAAEDSRQRMVAFFVANTVGVDWSKVRLSQADDKLVGLTP